MTKKAVSVWAKKNFLHWFIESYSFSSEGAKKLLLYIAESEDLLACLHIVLDGSYPRPLLVISSEGLGMPPFLMKTINDTLTDLESILYQLQIHREEPFYLTLYFPDRAICEPHRAVVETMNYDAPSQQQVLIDFELSLWLEEFKREMRYAELMSQIDAALDKGDKRTFRRLVKKLKNL